MGTSFTELSNLRRQESVEVCLKVFAIIAVFLVKETSKQEDQLVVYRCSLEKTARRLLAYDGLNYQLHLYAINWYEGPVGNIKRWEWELRNATDFWLKNYPSIQRLMYPNTPHLGCAYGLTQKHGKRGFWLKVVCAMDQKRNPWDPFMPKPYGGPCKKDHDCHKFGWGFVCYASMGLCFDRSDSLYWIA